MFRDHLSKIATQGRYTLNELEIFSNPLLNKLFLDTTPGGVPRLLRPQPPAVALPELSGNDRKLLSAELIFKMQQLYDSNQILLKEKFMETQKELAELRSIALARPQAAVAALSVVHKGLLEEDHFQIPLAEAIMKTQQLFESNQAHLIEELKRLRTFQKESKKNIMEPRSYAAVTASSASGEEASEGEAASLSSTELVYKTQQLLESNQNHLEEELLKAQKELVELRMQLESRNADTL